MEKFTGTKTIKARPMNLGEYNAHQKWELPTDQDSSTEGYLVGYSDAKGNFDGPMEAGCYHISWSPKDVFESAYSKDSAGNKVSHKYKVLCTTCMKNMAKFPVINCPERPDGEVWPEFLCMVKCQGYEGPDPDAKIEIPFMKTPHNSDVSGAHKNVKDIRVVGDGDMFQLLCEASSEKEGWMKSTKALQVDHGCLIQVTTQQRNPDGSYAVAEALTFVDGVKIVPDKNNGRKLG